MTKYYIYLRKNLEKRIIIFLDKNNESNIGISYFFERDKPDTGAVSWKVREMSSLGAKKSSYSEVIALIGKRGLTKARKMVAEELLEYA